ncbi:MAG: imm11 family protein [Hyalangium sp.]|uniref:imm11 family protein n=1 Tax=Hyalangium sp. TaxID=2028555 RepID=UPI003899D6FB
MHSFSILSTSDDPKYCLVDEVPEPLRSKKWRISEGRPMEHRYPPDVVLKMDRAHKGLVVPDLVANTERIAIVSTRLKGLLEQHSGARIEFLPVSIANHKGRIAAKDYCIANVLDHVDCIDKERSEVEELNPDPTLLSGLFRLQVLQDRIPSEAKMFRLKTMPTAILIREDLRALLDAENLTGIRHIAMGEECAIY